MNNECLKVHAVSENCDRLRVISKLDEFREIEDKWNALLSQTEVDCPFLRHEWLVKWWECFGGEANLHVVVWEDHERLLGGAPLMQKRRRILGLSCNTLEFLANGHSYRSDMVVESKYRSQFVCLLCSHFQDIAKEWGMLWLRDIPEESGTVQLLSQARLDFFVELACPMTSPYIPLSGSWKSYLESRSAHFRANLRRRNRSLAELGKVTFHIGEKQQDFLHLLQEGLKLEASGWKGHAGSAIIKSPATLAFYSGIARWAAENGWLRLNFLFLNDKAIAFDLSLDYASRIYLLKVGHDESFARYSPGQLLRMKEIEAAFACGHREYDFLGFDMPWKMEWTKSLRRHTTVAVYGKGFLPTGLNFWQNRMLPKLRASRVIRKMVLERRSGRRSAD